MEDEKQANARAHAVTSDDLDAMLIETYRMVLEEISVKSGRVFIITNDSDMLASIAAVDRYAPSKAPVLITGESGVGKEVFGQYIHQKSNRSAKPFIKVNCSAIPESLFESEFFGHEKGAFSGADRRKQGKFEIAHGGTLFLDEIGDLPLLQQAKLLRVIEDGEITPVGGSAVVPVDVRLICATNRDIGAMRECGQFREDLYFRLDVLRVRISPLRERRNDIPLLAAFLLSAIAHAEGGIEKYFEPGALERLKTMPFPGNVRELKNMVYRLYLASRGQRIGIDDIGGLSKHDGGAVADADTDPYSVTMPFRDFRRRMEEQYLACQLRKHEGNITRTAAVLSMSPGNLFRKLKSLGLL